MKTTIQVKCQKCINLVCIPSTHPSKKVLCNNCKDQLYTFICIGCGKQFISKIENTKTRKEGRKYCSKTCCGKASVRWNTGKILSTETREKLSKAATIKNNGFVKTKFYTIFCPTMNQDVKVQGSWELKFAQYLTKKNIKWIRSKSCNLKYKLHDDDYMHTYFPDFYLPDTNEYIEIKGYWWKSKDGRVDDHRKMDKVKINNPDKKIVVIEKKEFEKITEVV